MTKDDAKKLREPFPPELIGKLPRAGIKLDYVGHAAVTDRLLQVDPEWTWEALALDSETAAPVISENVGGMAGEPFGLWIALTVCGVTRPGFGGGKNAKECISDAIRNAAMRFGVGLDLWSKEDLQVEEVSTPVESGDVLPKYSHASSSAVKLANYAQHEKITEAIDALEASDPSKDWAALAEAASMRDFSHGITALTGPEAEQLAGKLAEFLAKQLKKKAAAA